MRWKWGELYWFIYILYICKTHACVCVSGFSLLSTFPLSNFGKNKKRKRKKFLLFLSKKISALTLFISLSLNLQRGRLVSFSLLLFFFFKKKIVSVAHELIILNVYLLINNKFVIIALVTLHICLPLRLFYVFEECIVLSFSSEKQSNKDEYKSPQCSSVSFKAW